MQGMGRFRRHHRRGKRVVYWLILAAAAAICTWAIGDFAYRGIQTSGCSQENYDPDTTAFLPQTAVDSPDCRQVLGLSELHQRRDAATALLGFSVITASAVLLSKARRRTKKKLLALEFGVAVLVLAFTFIVTIATR
jgi:hypothetical protein